MLPTVINLIIPAGMDIPASGWKEQKAYILKKIIEVIPRERIELLTFNRDEMIRQYKNRKEDIIFLNINVDNMKLRSKGETSLKARIVSLLESKLAHVSKYARKLQPGKKTSQTCISIDIGSD